MESLAIMVSIIVLSCSVIAAFVGFVIGDNFDGYLPGVSGAIIPGLFIVFYFSIPLSFFWCWFITYSAGYGVGYLFRTIK